MPLPLVVRATVNATGAITFTGNTLGLSRGATAGVPGTIDSIGAFVTVDTSSRYGTYPFGTTNQYLNNSSAANLVLPAGSSVLYAELIWGGTYNVESVNLSAFINDAVTLTTPGGTTFNVLPDTATANNVDIGGGLAYVRSANVTTIIQQSGGGFYTVGRVVGTIVVSDSTISNAGWTLGVIYQNPSLPFRNMSLRAGAILIQANSEPVTTTLTGFATPITGVIGGRALFSAQEGDANRTGDQALFGPAANSLVALSGPNNFANNFFASQINNDAGQLDTTGTFGTRNQTNGAPGTNISAGRQGWDITNVDVSARLVNNQTSAVLRLTTSGDAYLLNANAIQVDINAPKISVAKSSSVPGGIVGDTITYTVTVSNTGTASAFSVVLSDPLPAGSAFAAGSVTVGGAAQPAGNIVTGVPIGTVAFGSSVTVTYRARIASLPSPQQLVNQANAAFTFQSVAGGPSITGVIPSNAATVIVYSPNLAMVKSADTANAAVGTTVTYTIRLANSGNAGATTTVFDNIPAGSTFIPGSVTVNGTAVGGANPVSGVPIGVVPAGGSAIVTFQVVVNTLPSPPQLTDQATASYTFQPPDGRTVSGSAASNSLTLPVSLPNITVSKSVSLTAATVGDILTYTAAIANSGAAAVTSAVFADAIPAGAVFVAGSTVVNGTPRATADPGLGFSLGTLGAGTTTTVSFQVRVDATPPSGQLSNQANVSYQSGVLSGTSSSSPVVTTVSTAAIILGKSASEAAGTVGDTIVYTLSAANTGNAAAALTLTDTIPGGSAFVPGSVTLNGVPLPGASPLTGIPAGTLTPGGTATVTFAVTVQTLPSPPQLTNQAFGAYTYTLTDGRTVNRTVSSNTVVIPVSNPNVTVVKSANLAGAAVNDILTYTVVVSNNGITPVTRVNLTDIIPAGAAFVPGSVTIGGSPSPAANPETGILLGSVSPGTPVPVTFQAIVQSLPASAQLANRSAIGFSSGAVTGVSYSNTVTTLVYQPVINIAKSPETAAARIGDQLAYTFVVSNTGSYPAYVTLTDNVPPGSTFITNSVIVGGSPQPGEDPVSGIVVGIIQPGSSTTVTYKVIVSSLPPSQQLVNQAKAAYSFTLPDNRTMNGSSLSNTVVLPVSSPHIAVSLSASAGDVVRGDNLFYTAVVTNTGDAPASGIVYSTQLPAGTAFIPGTVRVDGSPFPAVDPTTGIPLGTLAPGASVTVTYEVRISMPTTPQVVNQSTVSFTSGVFSGTSSSNTTLTPVFEPDITVVKSADIAQASVGGTIVYVLTVANNGNIAAQVTLTDTIPAATSFLPNSVIVGGIPQASASPATGIDAGTIAPGASVQVRFSVVVDSLPNPQILLNQATAAVSFTPPDGRTIQRTALSNALTIPVSAPNVTVVKSTAAIDATPGDTVIYSIAITNSGIEPVNNVVFSDLVQLGTTFVPGSFTLNSVVIPNADPNNGVALGSIPAGGTVGVTFAVAVNQLPASGQLANQSSVTFTSGTFSGTSFSNTVLTPVLQPIISIAKTASTANATVGDTVNYTFTISNTGNFPGFVVLTDPIPDGTTFQPNSVSVGGTPQPGANPVTGITIGTLDPGATVTASFAVVINVLPVSQQLTNQATGTVSFTLPDTRTLTQTSLSNTVTVPVSAPNVSVVKSTATTSTTVGDTITYTVIVTNQGITDINNAIFSDPVPAGTTFLPGTLTVDGVARAGANPASGVNLGAIAPGSFVTVAFNVSVDTLPSTGTLSNRSVVSFTSGAFSAAAFSNTVTTPVYQPVITALKTGSTTNATLGNQVTYTIAVSNNGNYPAFVVLTDILPAETPLVPNSVIVGGAAQAGADPGAGLTVGTVGPGQTVNVVFTVTVAALPPSQQISNQSTLALAFTLPDGRTINRTAASNVLTYNVSAPNLSVIKSSVAIDAVVGDTVTYTIAVTNTGIDTVNNVVLHDLMPAGTSFIPGTVTVNGNVRPSDSPVTGVSLGALAAGDSATVAFQVAVNTLPSPATLTNASTVSFTSGVFSGSATSNTVTIPVYQPIIGVLKTADTTNATVGDTITYSLAVTNTGNYAANVTITDAIPPGANFVPNSVQVNGVPQPGANPAAGISVGTVLPGASVIVTLTLQATVDVLPTPQQLVNQATATFTFIPPDLRQLTGTAVSNTLTIPVSSPDVAVVKTANVIDAVVGDTITYTITVTNEGIENVNNVVLLDPVQQGALFVPGSVTVNGVSRPSDNPDIGILIGTIAPGASAIVSFEVTIV
ncbi:conserved repeat domain-containing protein [Paenibacillus sp. UNCCL117]|uniref:DUF7507 domain-containing protein n=1 Tax=unclassified Paenibacillus TaxID=185978 RepID=UPI00088B6EFC|nr:MULTISPECIES: DUF11 domain-containing protein [unclassified Paenibacillus]SDE23852.1 conserved repeat domain-containing protein [Paenibacillus sp. cl123]SFW42475.1 conserved repeat domain-containing protein [Paenibacillus sp. UNCCL117]